MYVTLRQISKCSINETNESWKGAYLTVGGTRYPVTRIYKQKIYISFTSFES